MKLETRILLLALAVGIPPALLIGIACWWQPSGWSGWAVPAGLALLWFLTALLIRTQLLRPLRTILNLLMAFREGDYSFRARIPARGGLLWQILQEVNSVADVLQAHRVTTVEAQALLRQTLDEVDVAVFVFGPQHRLQLLNRCAQRYLNRSADASLGKPAHELGLASMLEGECPRIVDVSPCTPGTRWELRRGSYMEGGIACQVVLLTDLTRALEEEERCAWESLIHVLRHEVNNSLAPISSIADSLIDMLKEKPIPQEMFEDLEQGLEVIRGRSAALHRFIRNHSLPVRASHLEPQPARVAQWVQRVLDLERRLPVSLVPGPDLVVMGDLDLLDHLLINLVRNAVEAAGEGGGHVTLGWLPKDAGVCIWIEDDGPGLPRTGDPFMPFFTTKPAGTGIGLFVSRRIAQAHGGRLALKPCDGRVGCRAELYLPFNDASPQRVSGSGHG